MAKPIQELTRKSTKLVWRAEQQTAFQEQKWMIMQADTMAYYKVCCRMQIVASVSPVGLGAVLTQLLGDVWRVIAYASRILIDVERCCSQTEKQALSLCGHVSRLKFTCLSTTSSWKMITSPWNASI